MACLGVLVLSTLACDQPPTVDELLASMTLEEKLTLLRGATDPEGESGAGYMPGVPRLGIPPLRLADGPAGIRTRWPATALPAPVALGSTFDPSLARAYGEVVGREGRARNQDVLLSPMVNIVRVPHAGRNFETFSEDPLLSARMVAEEVTGVQEQGLIATVKHYIANNFERARSSASADVSDRALHEIYLPGFEAAIEAGAGAVMCAYNRVNGVYACDNPDILNRILRDELGFQGWVMTDWGARHTLDALGHGLDQEMPGQRGSSRRGVYFGDSLQAAVEEGRIPLEWVDRAAARILGQMRAVGLLDGSIPPRPEMDEEAGAAAARRVALAGAVLLRNENDLLPLDSEELGSVLVVGPTARTPLIGGGGSSRVTPLRTISFLEALEGRAGTAAPIRHLVGMELDGAPIPSSALAPPPGTAGGPGGLLRTTTDSVVVGVDPEVDFTGDAALPAGARFSWTGTLTVPSTGEYEIRVHTRGGRANLSLNGRRMGGGGFGGGSLLPTVDGMGNSGGSVYLEAGVAHEITLTGTSSAPSDPEEGTAQAEPFQLRLAWITPQLREADLEEAARAAREADAVVLFAHQEGTEGSDRPSLSLPGVQDELIARVAAANPRTVVVLNTGAPVLMPWIEEVGAVLQVWYGGQEGGETTAALLLGEANPRGKLPVTFPRTETAHATGNPARYPGIEGRAAYDEGVFVGYRWFDAEGIEPLFPFGHGLSYTTFEYADLEVRPTEEEYEVTFTLTNTGPRAGVEVPQLYLGGPGEPPVPMPPMALADFQAVELAPGQSRRVSLRIDSRALSYWSETDGAWVRIPGVRPVYVGASSRDLRLRATTEG
jgi:beta-glucosidase